MRTALLLGVKYAYPYIRRKAVSVGKKALSALVPSPGEPAFNPFAIFPHRRPQSMSFRTRPSSYRPSRYELARYAGVTRSRYGALANARRKRRLRYNYPDLADEVKYLDMFKTETSLNGSSSASTLEVMPTSGCTNCISCPAVGDSSSSRDGHRFVMKSIQVKGYIRIPAEDITGTVSSEAVHGWVALVLDTQTNRTAINSEDIFTQIISENEMDVIRNMTHPGRRFRVLRFMKWTCNNRAFQLSGGHTYISEWYRRFKFYKKLNIPVTCKTDSTTADVASVIDNSLSIIASDNYPDTADPKICYIARLRFRG